MLLFARNGVTPRGDNRGVAGPVLRGGVIARAAGGRPLVRGFPVEARGRAGVTSPRTSPRQRHSPQAVCGGDARRSARGVLSCHCRPCSHCSRCSRCSGTTACLCASMGVHDTTRTLSGGHGAGRAGISHDSAPRVGQGSHGEVGKCCPSAHGQSRERSSACEVGRREELRLGRRGVLRLGRALNGLYSG